MRKWFLIILCVGFLAIPLNGLAGKQKMKKEQKFCHEQCTEIKKESIKTCIDTNQRPLTQCIQKAVDAKKECMNKCRKKD